MKENNGRPLECFEGHGIAKQSWLCPPCSRGQAGRVRLVARGHPEGKLYATLGGSDRTGAVRRPWSLQPTWFVDLHGPGNLVRIDTALAVDRQSQLSEGMPPSASQGGLAGMGGARAGAKRNNHTWTRMLGSIHASSVGWFDPWAILPRSRPSRVG